MEKIKKNIIDRAVEFVAPIHAAKRTMARMQIAASGSYHGASTIRRAVSEWFVSKKSADADVLPDLPTLRERSRDLVRNSPLAGGTINTNVTNIVGSGLTMQSRVDRDVLSMTEDEADAWQSKTEREWRLWAESYECDIERKLNFGGIQELTIRQAFENGEAFIIPARVARKNMPYDLRMQMIESDRVVNEKYVANTRELSGGIKKDQYGAPVEYHILEQHPGNILQAKEMTWKKVPAFGRETGLRSVIHLYKILRPGQSRGIPYLAPVIEAIKQIDRYTEAEIMAAVITSMLTVFIHSETPAGFAPQAPISETNAKGGDQDIKLGNGAVVELGLNEKIETVNPLRPNTAFDPFVMSILRQIGVALELPFEILIKHFTASYSAARAAMLEAWKFFLSRRRWIADNFCQVVYEIWMFEAVAKGRIIAPGFFDDPIIRKAYLGSEWVGNAQGQIDPLKEVDAATKRVNEGFTTRSYETAQMTGMDYDKVHKQTVKENKMRQELLSDPAELKSGGVAPGNQNQYPSDPQGDGNGVN